MVKAAKGGRKKQQQAKKKELVVKRGSVTGIKPTKPGQPKTGTTSTSTSRTRQPPTKKQPAKTQQKIKKKVRIDRSSPHRLLLCHIVINDTN